jgi:alkylated DNA repair dioxygenase AlkB
VAPHQRSLFGLGEPALAPPVQWEHLALDDAAWVEVARGLVAGADALLDALVASVPWTCGRSRMYDRVLDDPRLTFRYAREDALPHPVLDSVRDAIGLRYGVELGGAGCNHYRDGHDSVAFHADRELRDRDADAIVAVLTLGERRPFLLRPKQAHQTRQEGGVRRSLDLAPGPGDLLVMGGRCQHTWEHGVPKVARRGPRVSVTWRAFTP